MKPRKSRIRRLRVFSEAYRKDVVEAYESGQFGARELSRLHHVSEATVYRWIARYSNLEKRGIQVVEMKDSSLKRVKDLEKQIAELERTVGQKQIMIDFLEKMIELAKTDLGIDIKKNFSTQPSAGSGKTPKP